MTDKRSIGSLEYRYRADILRVVDADTVWAAVDKGFDDHQNFTFRLAGIDAPERGTDEGLAAANFLSDLIHGRSVVLQTIKDRRERYGRYLAVVFVTIDGEEINVNEYLIEHGHARPYMATGESPEEAA